MANKMTRKEAMLIVIRGAQKYLTYLEKQRATGPGGIEFHLEPFITELNDAIEVIRHG